MVEENLDEIPHFECNVFLLLPTEQGPIKTHFKVSGNGLGVIESFEGMIGERIKAGYLPDTNGRAGSAAPGNQQQASSSPAVDRPSKFTHTDGNVFYINESRKEAGKYFIARKDKGTGKYVYLRKNEAPEAVRLAYGDLLS